MQENSENSAEEPKVEENPPETEEQQNIPPPENEKPDEIAELRKKIEEFELVNKNLQNELTKKADVVSEMEKSRTSFEKEFAHVSCRR